MYGVCLDFIYCGNRVYILALYRIFDSNTKNFLTELKMYFDSVTDSTLSTLVVGLNNDLMTKVTFL